jgi:2-oxoglutarate ferredoxin oxidoreductase subunit delta
LCIEFCPADVLVLGMDNRPRPIYPEKCTACRWCELHCPDFAIFITEIEEDAQETPTSQAVAEVVADAVADVFGDKVAEHAARAIRGLAAKEADSSGEIADLETEPGV